MNIFAYLRDEVGYESYVGSFRGAPGTLWSEAGNSLDEASLGVALFRLGIPARYAHGILSDANAQALILTMFPEPTQVVGYLRRAPKSVIRPTIRRCSPRRATTTGFRSTSAPASRMPTAPVCPAAQSVRRSPRSTTPSTKSSTPCGTKYDSALEAETLSQAVAAFSGSTGLTTATVLDKTWNTVELVGKPVSVGQFVDDVNQGGLAFTSRR